MPSLSSLLRALTPDFLEGRSVRPIGAGAFYDGEDEDDEGLLGFIQNLGESGVDVLQGLGQFVQQGVQNPTQLPQMAMGLPGAIVGDIAERYGPLLPGGDPAGETAQRFYEEPAPFLLDVAGLSPLAARGARRVAPAARRIAADETGALRFRQPDQPFNPVENPVYNDPEFQYYSESGLSPVGQGRGEIGPVPDPVRQAAEQELGEIQALMGRQPVGYTDYDPQFGQQAANLRGGLVGDAALRERLGMGGPEAPEAAAYAPPGEFFPSEQGIAGAGGMETIGRVAEEAGPGLFGQRPAMGVPGVEDVFTGSRISPETQAFTEARGGGLPFDPEQYRSVVSDFEPRYWPGYPEGTPRPVNRLDPLQAEASRLARGHQFREAATEAERLVASNPAFAAQLRDDLSQQLDEIYGAMRAPRQAEGPRMSPEDPFSPHTNPGVRMVGARARGPEQMAMTQADIEAMMARELGGMPRQTGSMADEFDPAELMREPVATPELQGLQGGGVEQLEPFVGRGLQESMLPPEFLPPGIRQIARDLAIQRYEIDQALQRLQNPVQDAPTLAPNREAIAEDLYELARQQNPQFIEQQRVSQQASRARRRTKQSPEETQQSAQAQRAKEQPSGRRRGVGGRKKRGKQVTRRRRRES